MSSKPQRPLVGLIEVTLECGHRCRHCLQLGRAMVPAPSLARLEALADELAAAGCLALGFTGGEPFTRPDMLHVIRAFQRRGFFNWVNTNAWAIGHEAELADMPKLEITVTLLSMVPATHDAITGVHGSHARAVAAIDALLRRGVRVAVDALAMKPNARDMPAIERFCRERGMRFQCSHFVRPSYAGDRRPLDFRISGHALHAYVRDNLHRWGRVRPDRPRPQLLCHAGRCTFRISPDLQLFPCNFWPDPVGSLQHASFEHLWRHAAQLHEIRAWTPEQFRCAPCEFLNVCGLCPAANRLETGSCFRAPDAACEFVRTLKDCQDEALAAQPA